MATKLTKKQQGELTEKLTGVIQKNNALQLRLSTDSSVNEMNVNQISGELNRIHSKAIGKELPTVITIPVNTAGYEINGIGTVYGGELNLDTKTLTSTLGAFTIIRSDLASVSTASTGIKYAVLVSEFSAAQATLEIYLDGYTPINSVPSSGQYIRSTSGKFYIYDNRFTDLEAARNILAGQTLVAELETPETYALTDQQILQLLDQL